MSKIDPLVIKVVQIIKVKDIVEILYKDDILKTSSK